MIILDLNEAQCTNPQSLTFTFKLTSSKLDSTSVLITSVETDSLKVKERVSPKKVELVN